jgi:hypothetical protein
VNFSGKSHDEWNVVERARFYDLIENLIIAFYNVGVSDEAMGSRDEARRVLEKAVLLSDKYLDEYTPIFDLCHKALDDLNPEQAAGNYSREWTEEESEPTIPDED